MQQAVIFDCEFLTASGAPRRFWCGPHDPDPTVVQVSAVRLGLDAPFALGATFDRLIRPTDRYGSPVVPDPLFLSLTELTVDRIAAEGQTLQQALADFSAFCGDDRVWSWGKDEFNLMAISTYVAGIAPPMPASRFHNACTLLLRAGVDQDSVHSLRSHTLGAHFGLPAPEGQAHDALYDARSVAQVLSHLLTTGRLRAADLLAAHP